MIVYKLAVKAVFAVYQMSVDKRMKIRINFGGRKIFFPVFKGY